MGQARALISISDTATQLKIYEKIKECGCSVRKVEEMVKELNESAHKNDVPAQADDDHTSEEWSRAYDGLNNQLNSFFGSKVQLTCDKTRKGKKTITINVEQELGQLMELFVKLP